MYGPTLNLWNQAYSPSGSSGGGSIRIPAAFSGLIDSKPTRGQTPIGIGSGRG